MKKAFLITLSIVFLLFLTFPFFYILSPAATSQTVDGSSGISYTLPYPGILPDHPLYFLKAARDKVAEFTIRDNIQKARHYLLLSDKRVEMAVFLMRKGEYELAITTFSKGEKYSLKIPAILKASKSQGVTYSSEMVDSLKKSNLKHQEILAALAGQVPKGQLAALKLVADLNSQVAKQLLSL